MDSDSETIAVESGRACILGMWQWDLRGDKIIISNQFIKSQVDIDGEHSISVEEWMSRVHPDDKNYLIEWIDRFKRGKVESTTLTYRLLTIDNSYHWINAIIKITEYENGLPKFLSCYQHDVDDFRKNEEFLNEVNLRLSKLVENFSGGILLEDENRKIFYINEEFCRLLEIPVPAYKLTGSDCSNSAEEVKHLFVDPDEFVASILSALQNNVAQTGTLLQKVDGTILERDYIPISNDDVLKGHLWLYRDVTKLKENENKLIFRLRFEELITELSSKFINLEWTNIDRAIDKALGTIATFISADRSYVFLFSEDKHHMNNSNEWVRNGVVSEKDILQNIPLNIFPWLMQKINNQEIIYVRKLEEMPAEASTEKEYFSLQNIKSLIVIPMVYNNESIGYIGFDAIKENREWADDSIKLLYVAANVITNTIKRKEYEANLIHERSLLRTIIDNIPDPIYVKDLEGRKILANQAELNILNAKKPEDILGKTDFEVYPADVALKTVIEDKMVVESGEALINKEGFVVTNSGDTKWFIGNKIPRRDPQGNITGLVGISYNITERKKSEEAIKESERKYRLVVDSIKEVIFSTDKDGLWTFLNPAWTEITGFTAEESIGTNFLNYVHEEDREKNLRLFEPLIERKKEFCRHEIRYYTKDGGFKWIEVFARLTIDDNDNITGTTGTLNDITARKKSEEEITKALAREKELNELKSKFVSMVSHEFRTPLAAILSSSDLLQNYWDKWTTEKRNSLLDKIKRSINNLIVLLNDVTEINRADSGKVQIMMEQIDASSLIEEVIEELRFSYTEKPNVRYEKDKQPVVLITDKKLIRLIYVNLISNAIKYTASENNVYVSSFIRNGKYIFSVKDEGIGIPSDDFKNLFEPFMRSKNVEKIKGTGLGLSIMKRAVELLKGTIEFSSEVNIGSVFTVYLPINIADQQ